MSFSKLASRIAKAEGKKVEVSVGNVREILRVLTDILAQDRLEKPAISGSAWVDFFEAVVRRSEAMRKRKK